MFEEYGHAQTMAIRVGDPFTLSTHLREVAGDRARTFMSRVETRASSLIISLIFVDCHICI